MENGGPGLKMYFLLNMGIFQPAMWSFTKGYTYWSIKVRTIRCQILSIHPSNLGSNPSNLGNQPIKLGESTHQTWEVAGNVVQSHWCLLVQIDDHEGVFVIHQKTGQRVLGLGVSGFKKHPGKLTWNPKIGGLDDDFPDFNWVIIILPETNSLHLKIVHPKRKRVFQPSIFRCYVSFREGRFHVNFQGCWDILTINYCRDAALQLLSAQ